MFLSDLLPFAVYVWKNLPKLYCILELSLLFHVWQFIRQPLYFHLSQWVCAFSLLIGSDLMWIFEKKKNPLPLLIFRESCSSLSHSARNYTLHPVLVQHTTEKIFLGEYTRLNNLFSTANKFYARQTVFSLLACGRPRSLSEKFSFTPKSE